MAGGVEDIEMEVLGRIRDLPLMNLIDLWGSLNLADLPDDVKGSKAMVIKQFLKHFMSDEVQNAADQGMATFILVRDYLNKHAPLAPPGKPDEEEAPPGPVLPGKHPVIKDDPAAEVLAKHKMLGGGSRHRSGSNPIPGPGAFFGANWERFMRREFKIKGSIGLPGQKDKLDFVTLVYQIECGLKKGYEDSDIVEAVVNAVSSDLPLKGVLVSKVDISLGSLRKILRSHYREQDANTMYTQLCRASQDPAESEQQFVTSLMLLRQKILFSAKEEHSEFTGNEELVQKQFVRAIGTGLRNDNIKNEIKPSLSNTMADEELLELLNKVCGDETERQKKLKNSGKKSVNRVDLESGGTCTSCGGCGCNTGGVNSAQTKKEKQNPLLEELKELRAQISVVTALKEDVELLKKELAEVLGKGGNLNRKKGHCDARVDAGETHCDHCFKCGSTEHKSPGCKKKN